jgi:hypothetical protein
MKQMAKNRTLSATPLAHDLPRLIEEAQRQPGLRQVMELVRQGQEAMRPLQELSGSLPFAASVTLGNTGLLVGPRR